MGNDANDMLWKEAFARLSEPYWDALLRFAVSLCHSQERGEDLVQTALLRGVRFFQKFCEKNFEVTDPRQVEGALRDAARARHFKNWLYKILKNVYLDDQAALNKWTFDSDEEALDNRSDDSGTLAGPFEHDPTFSLETPADPKDFARQEQAFYKLAADDDLKVDIDALSERQRSVLYLIAEDYSYKEVASILNIPIGTVMSTLSRGLAKLRSRITARKSGGTRETSEPVTVKGTALPPERRGASVRGKTPPSRDPGISGENGEVWNDRGGEWDAEPSRSGDRKVAEK